MTTKTANKRIVKTEEVCGGKPRIRGHRITVQNIAVWHDKLGWDADEIANEFDLNMADIYAALSYYFANQEVIDQLIERDETLIEEAGRQYASLLDQKLEGNRGQ